MSPTVHTFLIHGPEIVSLVLLPIGQLSEEAQESCNKFIKKYRVDNARKCSRTSNIEDVFKRLLVVSDPLISNHRKLPQKKIRSLSAEAIQLLIEPFILLQNGRMGVGPRYRSFLSIPEGRGLRAYTGWTTLPNLLNHITQFKDKYITNTRRFQNSDDHNLKNSPMILYFDIHLLILSLNFSKPALRKVKLATDNSNIWPNITNCLVYRNFKICDA
jgi:hypothetical protein